MRSPRALQRESGCPHPGMLMLIKYRAQHQTPNPRLRILNPEAQNLDPKHTGPRCAVSLVTYSTAISACEQGSQWQQALSVDSVMDARDLYRFG